MGKWKTETHKFKKGEWIRLDDIYFIQALAGGDWWEHDEDECGEDIVITRSVTIVIKWKED